MATDLIPIEPIPCEVVEFARFCTQCGSHRDATDAFCRRCGTELEVAAGQQHARPPVVQRGNHLAPQLPPLLARRWVVISILLVAGPIGLPALWFSPSFSRVTKIITSVLYFGLTAVLPLALAWYWLDYAMQPLVEAFPPIR